MGVSAPSLLPFIDDDNISGRPPEIQCMKKQLQEKKQYYVLRRSLGVLVGKNTKSVRATYGRSTVIGRPLSRVERRVRSLRRLVPSASAKYVDLEGLFQETADYIVGLEMQVKVMQILVKVLSD